MIQHLRHPRRAIHIGRIADGAVIGTFQQIKTMGGNSAVEGVVQITTAVGEAPAVRVDSHGYGIVQLQPLVCAAGRRATPGYFRENHGPRFHHLGNPGLDIHQERHQRYRR